MTLLLGPPGAGKTTLLKALAGKLAHSNLNVSMLPRTWQDSMGVRLCMTSAPTSAHRCHWLPCHRAPYRRMTVMQERCSCMAQVSGEVTYNGHTLDEFFPQRTASYVEQTDQHIAELTVNFSLAFAVTGNVSQTVMHICSNADVLIVNGMCERRGFLFSRCTRRSTSPQSARAWGTNTVSLLG